MKHAARAPWPDYAGRVIHEGGTTRHPDGMQGIVVCHADRELPEDQWVVRYEGSSGESRLCLQIGDKGQAVVVQVAG